MKCMIPIVLSSQRLQDVVVLNCSSLYFLSTVMLNSLMLVQRRKSMLNPFYISVNTLVLYTHSYVSSSLIYLENHIPRPRIAVHYQVAKTSHWLLFLMSIYDNKSQVPSVWRRPCDSNKCSCVQEPGNVDLLGVWWLFTLKSQRTCGRREVQRSVGKQMLLFFLDGKMLSNLRAFKKKYFSK